MTGVPPSGSGHSPKGEAASFTASPAKPSVPNAVRYATVVFCAPTDAELDAAVRPLFDSPGFSSDESKVRLTAASWSQDAMSVLDAIGMLADSSALDPYELRDCIRESAQLRTWEDCLAKFAEWDLELRDGDLVDLREEAA